jgi:uncharacterized protein with NRDE domain
MGTRPELWLAANRDERLDRSWESPRLLRHQPPVFGGRDVLAGGSWLATNLTGCFVVAVTNARLGAPKGERSRGELVVDVAAQQGLAEAVALLAELDLERYGPFNVLVADPFSLWLATNTPAPSMIRAEEPIVAVGNDSLAAPGERVLAAASRAAAFMGEGEARRVELFEELLSDHGGPDPLCRHGERFGTVCSTVLQLEAAGLRRYLFAPGPPCRTPFVPLTPPGARMH